jgi:hypothetical protein
MDNGNDATMDALNRISAINTIQVYSVQGHSEVQGCNSVHDSIVTYGGLLHNALFFFNPPTGNYMYIG